MSMSMSGGDPDFGSSSVAAGAAAGISVARASLGEGAADISDIIEYSVDWHGFKMKLVLIGRCVDLSGLGADERTQSKLNKCGATSRVSHH